MTPRRFVITGPGHSGTTFLARLATELGHPCGHETVFDFDRERSGAEDRWIGLEGESSLTAMSYFERLPAGTPVLYARRAPLDFVRSFLRCALMADTCPCHEPGEHRGAPFARWAGMEMLGLFDEPSEGVRCARYYHEHAQITRRRAQAFGMAIAETRLEDYPTGVPAERAASSVRRLWQGVLGRHISKPEWDAALDRVRACHRNYNDHAGVSRLDIDTAHEVALAAEYLTARGVQL